MKRKFLLFATLVGFLSVSLSSYRSGMIDAVEVRNAAGTTSSSPVIVTGIKIGSSITAPENDCGNIAGSYTTGCHAAAGAGTLSVNTVIYDDYPTNSHIKTTKGFQYGAKYGVQITATLNPATYPADTFWGFQCVLYGWANYTTVPGAPITPGSVSAFDIGSSEVVTAIRQQAIVIEQKRQLLHRWLSTNNHSFKFTFCWTAPAAGDGVDSVEIRTLVCAVDSDGTANGDAHGAPSSGHVKMPYGLDVPPVFKNASFNTFPNPAGNNLSIQISNLEQGTYNMYAFDVNGKQILNREINVNSSNYTEHINSSAWPAGVYFIQVSRYGIFKNIPVVKE